MKLEVQLIPKKSWGFSLANKLKKEDWDNIRRSVYRKYNFKCSCCGISEGRMSAHEVWNFDDDRKIQTLKDIICVCDKCHEVIHFGRTSLLYPHKIENLIDHWAKVNKVHRSKWPKYFSNITDKYFIRSKINFTIVIGENWKLKK